MICTCCGMFYSTCKLSHDLETICLFRNIFSMSPFADLATILPSRPRPSRCFRARACRLGFSRICRAMPTRSSSTLWLRAAESSMYFALHSVQTSRASTKGEQVMFRVNINYYCRGRFVYASIQWETTLHCNVVSHWMGAYTKWFRLMHQYIILQKRPCKQIGVRIC